MCIRILRSFFLALLLNLIIAVVSFAVTVQLPKTGQMKCYGPLYNEIACSGTGQDGDTLSGIAWPAPRFQITYCNTNNPCPNQLSDCDNNISNNIVTDNLTGLMWPVSGNLAGMMTWDLAVDYAAHLTLCGYTDWALPNLNELESLVNADVPDTAVWLNGQGLSNMQSFYYWTSTSYAFDTDFAWIVNMLYGSEVFNGKDRSSYVLPVRLGQTGIISLPVTGQKTVYRTEDDGDTQRGVSLGNVPRFNDNGKGAIRDNLTGLMWLKDANCIKNEYPGFDNDIYWGTAGDGAVTWQHALYFIGDINNTTYPKCGAGYQDWRLPNKREIRSLIDYLNFNPTLPAGHLFSGIQSYFYWTSTTSAYLPSSAWMVDLWEGGMYNFNKEDVSYVWPVRNVTIYDTDYDMDGYIFGVDCDDSNAAINPGATDANCNGVDENCAGGVDDQYVASSTTCGAGECASAGQLQCLNGALADTCIPGTPVYEGPLGDPLCGDTKDNDCDGVTDTNDPSCLTLCVDADGDGYGANGDASCPNGMAVDCNDYDTAVYPGASDLICNGADNNCNGQTDEEYITTATVCGTGVCAATGQLTCQGGALTDTCSPGQSTAESSSVAGTCTDLKDNNCDGLTDSEDPNCPPSTLIINISGKGKVNNITAGLTCKRACIQDYTIDKVMVLKAKPAKGYIFIKWKGACKGRKKTCTVTMSKSQMVKAVFRRM